MVSDGSDDVWLVRWQPMMAHGGVVGSVDCVAVVHAWCRSGGVATLVAVRMTGCGGTFLII